MAIEFLTITWQMSPYKAEKLLAHLAFADWANIAGEFHPSADELAEKARLTRRGAFQVIAQMLEDGEIELIAKGGGRGQRNRYRFAAHYREAVAKLSHNWERKRARKTAENGERETPFETANGERETPNRKTETVNEKHRLRQQTVNEKAENGERESSAYKELSPSCIPSIKNPSERERETRARSAPFDSVEETTADYKPKLDAIEVALCQAVGWITDLLDPMQYSGVRAAAKSLRGQPTVISAPASLTVERIGRAREFYQSQKKFSFAPSWIARDWAGLLAWIEAGNAGVRSGAAGLEAARAAMIANEEARAKRKGAR